jgi:predicted membrane channel-forming protein YqfA (hemolysin III family)
MSGAIAQWSHGLLLAALCAILGLVGFAIAANSPDRRLASGLFLQGVLLMFSVAGAFHHSNELHLGGLIVLGLLLVNDLSGSTSTPHERRADEDEPV